MTGPAPMTTAGFPEPTETHTDPETGVTYASFPGDVYTTDTDLDGSTDDPPVWLDADTDMTIAGARQVGWSLLAAAAWREQHAGGAS